jgi:predicted ATP-dependent endonuclease of OLD family
MNLKAYRVRNFRRLKDVTVDLSPEVSIFVGSNNSGKTSATQVIHTFLEADRRALSIHDFNCETWTVFDTLGSGRPAVGIPPEFPIISIDLWFSVAESDLHRVMALLPDLDWRNTSVGIRVAFCPNDSEMLLANYSAARAGVKDYATVGPDGQPTYAPWPSSLREYLAKSLSDEYRFRYYVLDRARFNDDWKEDDGYQPIELPSDNEVAGGRTLLKSLIKVDYVSAQRYLGDSGSTGDGHSRAEDLSKCFSRFYTRHLEQRADDHDALRALSVSEQALSDHFTAVFKSTLAKLGRLGYPGFSNPHLEIKSALRLERLMTDQHASVHYKLGDVGDSTDFMLPDSYNGLGFKNLIYMVIELLDLHESWITPSADDSERPPLHLVFIEEPEAHMHAQLQQAFIRQVLELLAIEGPDASGFTSQVVVTTHSTHILYELGFRPIRYFHRSSKTGREQTSKVYNLSAFYERHPTDRDFLERYMKLTHCDLFFADAAILVEGNVERLLLPQMIRRHAPDLGAAYLSILEVGGAFAHRFSDLIDFLELTTLVITDIDSVNPSASAARPSVAPPDPDAEADIDDEDEDTAQVVAKPRKACQALDVGAVTSNAALKHWLPIKSTIAELHMATVEDRTPPRPPGCGARIRVTFQGPHELVWNSKTAKVAGRTLEEAFALQNLAWTQDPARKTLGLHIKGGQGMEPLAIASRIYARVKGTYFSKTDFALTVLSDQTDGWTVPKYIADGLSWLDQRITPEILRSRLDPTELIAVVGLPPLAAP